MQEFEGGGIEVLDLDVEVIIGVEELEVVLELETDEVEVIPQPVDGKYEVAQAVS